MSTELFFSNFFSVSSSISGQPDRDFRALIFPVLERERERARERVGEFGCGKYKLRDSIGF